ncbi:MAG: ASC-1-like (ASCH) protein [Candidatus Nanohaloarchaea archaeon]|jgi:ASC-1-like (ASCH) protein
MAVWELKVREKYYNAIMDGEKTVEARAPELDGEFRYEEIEKGDVLEFCYNDDKDPSSCFEAKDLTYYESIDELLEGEVWDEIVPEAEEKDEVIEEFRDLPEDYNERIEEHGIYAIHIGKRRPS